MLSGIHTNVKRDGRRRNDELEIEDNIVPKMTWRNEQPNNRLDNRYFGAGYCKVCIDLNERSVHEGSLISTDFFITLTITYIRTHSCYIHRSLVTVLPYARECDDTTTPPQAERLRLSRVIRKMDWNNYKKIKQNTEAVCKRGKYISIYGIEYSIRYKHFFSFFFSRFCSIITLSRHKGELLRVVGIRNNQLCVYILCLYVINKESVTI